MDKAPQHIVRGVFKTVSILVLIGIGAVGLTSLLFFHHLTRDLPEVSKLKTYQASHATEVFSDDDRKIGEFTTERRYPVKFQSIPRHVIQAFLAAEDAKFYEHGGIDLAG